MMIANPPFRMMANSNILLDCLETKRKREKFLPEEDEKLRKLVENYGTNSWETISQNMPGRNARQCRERWKHYLSSAKSKEPWTPEEDMLLYQKMEEFGPKWTKIATFFEDRTDIQVKSRWMQKFASHSNFHLKNRAKNPLLVQQTPMQISFAQSPLNYQNCPPPSFPPQPCVQFVPQYQPVQYQQPYTNIDPKPAVNLSQPPQVPTPPLAFRSTSEEDYPTLYSSHEFSIGSQNLWDPMQLS